MQSCSATVLSLRETTETPQSSVEPSVPTAAGSSCGHLYDSGREAPLVESALARQVSVSAGAPDTLTVRLIACPRRATAPSSKASVWCAAALLPAKLTANVGDVADACRGGGCAVGGDGGGTGMERLDAPMPIFKIEKIHT